MLRNLIPCSLIIIAGCGIFETRLDRANQYLARRPDISQDKRKAIIAGKAIPGMFPDEANAAAGYPLDLHTTQSSGGFVPFPPQHPQLIVLRQRHYPESMRLDRIRLRYRNKTQFDTEDPVIFTVHFDHGRAVEVERHDRK